MDECSLEKTRLRRQYLDVRRALSAEAWARGSEAVRRRLEAWPSYAQTRALLTYVSSKDNEVDTLAILRDALARGVEVLVPVMGREPGQMAWSRLLDLDALAPARFGVLEPMPAAQRLTTPPEDALCLVPGVAFTREGDRIGYGGGYYDRFLSSFPGETVGLAFDVQLADWIPVGRHDQPVRRVCAESAWHCRGRAASGD